MVSTPPDDLPGGDDGKGDENVSSVRRDPLTPQTPDCANRNRMGPPMMLPPSEETPPKRSLPKNNMNTTFELSPAGEDSDFNELPESEESENDSLVDPDDGTEPDLDFDEYDFVDDSRLCQPDPAGGFRCPHCHAHSEGLFHRCPTHYLERGLAVPPGLDDSSPKTEDCFDPDEVLSQPSDSRAPSEDEHVTTSKNDNLES